jgi:UDP-glucose 4-epimerase
MTERAFWKNRTVVVTGAAGFIGGHLVDAILDAGGDVVMIDLIAGAMLARHADKSRVQVISDDLRDFAWGSLFGTTPPHAIFHLAGTSNVQASIRSPLADFEANLLTTMRLLECARRADYGGPIIYLSSAAVYGRPAKLPIEESDPTRPISPYGVAKLGAERYLAVYCEHYGLKGASLRAFSVYGPRQRNLVVYELMSRILKTPQQVTIAGDGHQVRDFIFVADVVRALLWVARSAPLRGEVYNLASGKGRTVASIAEMLAQAAEAEVTLVRSSEKRQGDPDEWVADVSRLGALGFVPQTSLPQGLQRTLAWYRGCADV